MVHGTIHIVNRGACRHTLAFAMLAAPGCGGGTAAGHARPTRLPHVSTHRGLLSDYAGSPARCCAAASLLKAFTPNRPIERLRGALRG